jgi:hypothetical protein
MMTLNKGKSQNADIQLPDRKLLEKMLEIAKILSAGHKYVRVDLYLVDKKIYFGELTFTPGCGFGEFSNMNISKRFGSYFLEAGV